VLRSIQIENFAIVQKLDLELHQGLTIISGETGAGKSILIDALSLLLGERADATVVRQGCRAATVKAEFSLPIQAHTWLQHHAIPTKTNCQLRRVIYATGRSKAYINEHAIPVQKLKELGQFLVDIHGQHAHQSLLQQETQRTLLDALLPDGQILKQVAQCYHDWKAIQQALYTLGGETHDRDARLTLLRYQIQEFIPLELTTESLQQLEQEHRRLAHAHKLRESAQRALQVLDNEETGSLLAGLTHTYRELIHVQQHDAKLATITGLLDNTLIHAQEAIGELHHYIDHLEIDPQRLQDVEQRLQLLQDMARKHKIRVAELPDYLQELSRQCDELENYEQRARDLEQSLAQAKQIYVEVAEKLHRQRKQAAENLALNISCELKRLGMPNGQLHIHVTADTTPTVVGMDKVTFLVSTNVGYEPRPLHKVASGGELSRISLAIQVLTAQASGVPSLVFDEVDVGISGGVAEIVGQLLRQLGQQRQVLCITHLPQVASQGQQHLQVRKFTENALSSIQIQYLNGQTRIEEIARMLGGVEITIQTLAHAEEMLHRGTALS
jgi:DNA repair protein RecN (Recombination protein N)